MTKPARLALVRPRTESVQGTAAFGKFISVLQIIADATPAADMSALVRLTGMPRPTVYRIIGGLRSEGLVRADTRGRFALGPRLISLASKSWAAFDLRSAAADSLLELRDKTGETVQLAVPSGLEMVYIDKLESPQTVRMTSRIGTRVLLHASSVGKAYLSKLPRLEQTALLANVNFVRRTLHTIMTRKDLRAALATAERRGYATDKEETELEILGLGAAICDETGYPIGGISISIPKYRFDRAAERRYAEYVIACARQISAAVASAAMGAP